MSDVTWIPVDETGFIKDGDWYFVNLRAIEAWDIEQVAGIHVAQAAVDEDDLWFFDPTDGYAFPGVTHYMRIPFPPPPEEQA